MSWGERLNKGTGTITLRENGIVLPLCNSIKKYMSRVAKENNIKGINNIKDSDSVFCYWEVYRDDIHHFLLLYLFLSLYFPTLERHYTEW